MRRETFSLPEGLIPAGPAKGFNLSRWAIDHGGFTAFLLVLLLAAVPFPSCASARRRIRTSRSA